MTTQSTQTGTEEVAKARLLLVGNYLRIGVVVGKGTEWRPPNPGLGFLEAYVERPGNEDIEAYIIEIVTDPQNPVNRDDTSMWQEGLEGKIIAAQYSASQRESISCHLPEPWKTNSPQKRDRIVRIPSTILSAAGINSQEARSFCDQLSAPLSMKRSLSPEDLTYLRENRARQI